MRFDSMPGFGKHLREASPDHFSPVYVVIISDDYERKKVCKGVIAALKKSKKDAHIQKWSFEETPVCKVVSELSSPSLFGEAKIVFFDEVDKGKKEELEALSAYIQNPAPNAFLVLGSAKSAPLAPVVEKGKREVVVLDLSSEKPWDKKKRLEEWVHAAARARKKVVTQGAMHMLMEGVGDDLARLEQEVAKCALFVQERPHITEQDVHALLTPTAKEQLWKVAEKLAWDRDPGVIGYVEEASDLFVLIAQVRTQLQTGLIFAECLENGENPKNYLPRLYPKAIEKYQNALRRLSKGYFEQGLIALFECELKAKNSSLKPDFLWDYLCAKLVCNDALSPPKSPLS